ncbi:MAG: sigma-70 family RNA polymerase sigma factor [Alphaproteobacteria bacterium]|nr:sigma-70 family RNA polymerase sigma factor [Alphaproteobacteria bacterium]MBU0797468.1 sigma-70 family RNA polymerase sigma factor [Alphaproteobacteria bacterium]MBU0889223.1 sigma-70 family RNA polymerase sigma factor [Alphaproteobacteria bacterium]MBU1813812.1 sigma-70 family RNA polymerase sigma factor [Alphaproteobacteria bacterium]MBU2089190.1 sigma-70 family RNA polymerase sigma factor [Alphaproteobacteria bacterium]
MSRPSLGTHLAVEVDRLRRYARSLVRGGSASGDEAEDLVQETLLRGIERSSSWDGTRPVGPWLFTILHNLYVSRIRRSQTRQRALHHIGLIGESTAEAGARDRAEVSETIDALYRLPEEQRQALAMVALDDLSYEEAAARLDIPLGTLMSRLARGREALRLAVDRPGGGQKAGAQKSDSKLHIVR